MIFDCFTFFREKELLEIRVNELKKCKQPVTHILVEADHTFTGKPKPLYYRDDYAEDFLDFDILSVVVNNPIGESPWDRERCQRNLISESLKLLSPSDDDIIIISDADEIPDWISVDDFSRMNYEFAALIMKKYGYYLNCFEIDGWDRARIMKYRYLKDKSPEQIRNSGFENALPSGWHFGWLGGLYSIVEKFKSFSHQEFNNNQYANPQKIIQKLQTGQSLWSDDENDKWSFVNIDDTYPEYLRNNIEKFKHLIHV